MMYPSCMSRGTGDHLVPWRVGELGRGGGDGMGGGGRVKELRYQEVLALLSQLISRCEYLFAFCCVRG